MKLLTKQNIWNTWRAGAVVYWVDRFAQTPCTYLLLGQRGLLLGET